MHTDTQIILPRMDKHRLKSGVHIQRGMGASPMFYPRNHGRGARATFFICVHLCSSVAKMNSSRLSSRHRDFAVLGCGSAAMGSSVAN
jgi:hypothetical protein